MDQLGKGATVKRESPIEQELKHLGDCLGNLDDTIDRLRSSLTLILGDQKEPATTKGDPEGIPDSDSPALRSLKEFSRRIVAENETICGFIERMET